VPLTGGAGEPPVPFGDVLEEALHWACWASEEEIRSYLRAGWLELPEPRRRALLAWASNG
jgi:hypothetical protein